MTRKFLIRAFAVILAFVAADIAFGVAMRHVIDRSKGGDTRSINHINRHFTDSVAIFGSSRANHHYVATMFEDSLGLPAYNCGVDGNGILLAYCLLNNILARGEKPSVIIYDFFPEFDLYDNGDHHRALTRIRPYYDTPGLKDVIDDLSANEYAKLHINTYRYNTEFIQMVSDAVAPRQVIIKGYKPLNGTMSTDFVRKPDRTGAAVDPLKIKYLQKFIDVCRSNSIELVFVTSPLYFGGNADYRGLLERYGGGGLTFLDFSSDSLFTGRNELFVDPTHINDTGARRFTAMVIDSIGKLRL